MSRAFLSIGLNKTLCKRLERRRGLSSGFGKLVSKERQDEPFRKHYILQGEEANSRIQQQNTQKDDVLTSGLGASFSHVASDTCVSA